MTRNEAIKEAIRIWKVLARTGGYKSKVAGADKYLHCCPLCQYASDETKKMSKLESSRCSECPYYKEYGKVCFAASTVYRRWETSFNVHDRKLEATKFLAELKKIKLDVEEIDKDEILDILECVEDKLKEINSYIKSIRTELG